MGLGSRWNLSHPMVIVIILIVHRGRGWLVSVSVLRLLRVELVGRPVADVTVLFPVTVVRVGSGFHWDVRGEAVGGFVEAVVAGSIDLLSFAV